MRITRSKARVISELTINQNIDMLTYILTNLGAPVNDNDSVRKKYIDDLAALYLLLAGGTMSGNIAMGTKKLTGLGAPAAQNDSLRYGQTEIRNEEIAAAANIALSKLVDDYLLPVVMTTRGDMVYRGADNPDRVPAGAEGTVLTMGPADPGFAVHPAAKKVGAGSYAGNDSDDRQITVGFKCSRVIILEMASKYKWVLIPNACLLSVPANPNEDESAHITIHATDGFVVGDVTAGYAKTANYTTKTYYYWAISE